ncbi:DUF6753 family protein [Floridanema aerugineum]|uniref:DUF6753 family protein n=1 Tax=Floridaenema aerugineum BLCC-F46 TaxID=3153654 RepID=A0ABV4X081_9CYAN
MTNTSTESTNSQQILLDRLLEGRDSNFKSKVLDYIQLTELSPDDPAIIMAILTGNLAFMLEDAPASFEHLFREWSGEIQRALHLAEKLVVERQKAAIADAAKELVRSTESSQATKLFSAIIPAAGVLLGAIGLGFFMGLTVPPFLGGGLAGKVNLTQKEANTLRWALSDEGKFARNLMDWNRDYLKQQACESDAQALGAKLKFGSRTALSGYCFLWIEPPEKRKYSQ